MGDGTSYCSDRTYMSKDRSIPGYYIWVIISFDQVDFEDFILPEKWCVNVEYKEKEKTAINWLNSGNSQTNLYDYSALCKFLHYPKYNNSHHYDDITEGYIEITFEQFEKYVLKQDKNMAKKITGYKLIKKYPGCKKELGYIEPYTTGEFSQYPEFWEPVYEEPTKTLVLGSGKIAIKLGKNKAEVDGYEFNVNDLRMLLYPHTGKIKRPIMYNYDVALLDAKYKIGCSEFTLAEIKLIIVTYDSLNK